MDGDKERREPLFSVQHGNEKSIALVGEDIKCMERYMHRGGITNNDSALFRW